MYSSGYSQVSKAGPQGQKKMQYRSKGKSCGYYLRIIFFFSSLIQSLIIVSLVLFLVYGKTQDSASTARIQDLEESFSRLSIENVALRQQRRNLTTLLNVTVTEKARNDWDLLRLKHWSNTSANFIQDLDRRLTQTNMELMMCKNQLRFPQNCPQVVPRLVSPSGGCNCGLQMERVIARLELVESNFTQTTQKMKLEMDQIVKDRDNLNLEAIHLRREKSVHVKEIEFCQKSCKEDFVHSLSGVSNVSRAFILKIESLFPTHIAFQLTCEKQREHLEQIRTNCTTLSREVGDRFQNYLNNVGDQMSEIQSENSRLKAENLRRSDDYRVCSTNRTGLILEHRQTLEKLQLKHDKDYERLLLDKRRLSGDIEVLENSVNYKNKEVQHLTEQLKQLNMSCMARTGSGGFLGAGMGQFGRGNSESLGSTNTGLNRFGSTGLGSPNFGSTSFGSNKPGSTGLASSSLASSGSGLNKFGSTGSGSLSTGLSSSSLGSSTSSLNKLGSTGLGSSNTGLGSSSLSSTGSGLNKLGSTGLGSSSLGSSSSGLNKLGSTGLGSSSLGSSSSGLNKLGSTGLGSSSLGSSSSGLNKLGSSGLGSSNLGSSSSGLNKLGSTGLGSSSLGSSSSGLNKLGSTGLGSSSLGSSSSGLNKLGSTGLGSSSLGSSSSGLNKLGSTGLVSSSLGSTGSGTNKLGSTGLGSTSLGSTGLGSNKLGSTGLGSSSLGSAGSGLNKFGSNGLGSSSLGSTGSGLNKPDSTGLVSSSFGSTGLGLNKQGSTGLGSLGLGSTGLNNKPTTSLKSSSGLGSSLLSSNSGFPRLGLGSSNSNTGQSKPGIGMGRGTSSGSALGTGRTSGLGGGSVNVAQHLLDLQRIINPNYSYDERQDLARMLG
ncbi:plasmalemma vesicle associated protein a [Corythoichthys intestinalis]|uniref:plasmalemma vesicle associated protein a n=1 Tax=Corythoichthys intestinalis TaxID=161448 RepID=UPI0025A65D36|nr:plasmalemma vesicle associated protein a [Corythoichthys intestinalis]